MKNNFEWKYLILKTDILPFLFHSYMQFSKIDMNSQNVFWSLNLFFCQKIAVGEEFHPDLIIMSDLQISRLRQSDLWTNEHIFAFQNSQPLYENSHTTVDVNPGFQLLLDKYLDSAFFCSFCTF